MKIEDYYKKAIGELIYGPNVVLKNILKPKHLFRGFKAFLKLKTIGVFKCV